MRVIRGVPQRAPYSSVLTIGNFDGVHLGHGALLRRLREAAQGHALPAVVMTFEPTPREFFAPDNAPPRLATLREKLELLAAEGVDCVHVCRFDQRFAALAPSAFIDDVLWHGLAVRHLIVGDDFRFGRGRAGDFSMLQEVGAVRGFVVERTPTIEIDGVRASSSAVREALTSGDLARAGRLLGRAYCISGRVVQGARIGRTMGFPTANIGLKRRRPPLAGVFAVTVEGVRDESLAGVANIGTRPTVSGLSVWALEVHLLDFNQDLYGRHVRVNFLARLRDESRFPSIELLKKQIARDVDEARRFFSLAPGGNQN